MIGIAATIAFIVLTLGCLISVFMFIMAVWLSYDVLKGKRPQENLESYVNFGFIAFIVALSTSTMILIGTSDAMGMLFP